MGSRLKCLVPQDVGAPPEQAGAMLGVTREHSQVEHVVCYFRREISDPHRVYCSLWSRKGGCSGRAQIGSMRMSWSGSEYQCTRGCPSA